jgi:flagellin
MTDGITLTASIRSNLLSLNNASALLATTSERLSTGKKVNGALDNPSSFFTARGLTNRASDLTSRKDGLGQAISLLQATDKSIASITTLIEQAKATAQSAEEASSAGISTVSSVAASFVPSSETSVTSIETESYLIGTTNTKTFSQIGAGGTYAAGSTMSQFTGLTLTAGDTVTFTSSGYGMTELTTGAISGASTITQLVAAYNGMAGITASFNATTNDVDIAANGGTILTGTDTANVNWIDELGGIKSSDYKTDGTAEVTTTAVVSAGAVTFNLTGENTDMAAAAFGMSDADAASAIVINGTNSAIAAAEAQTVNSYTNSLTAAHADLSATYSATNRNIQLLAENGTRINFTDSTPQQELGWVQSGGATSITIGSDYGFDDGTTIATTDLLTTVFDGVAVNDSMQFGVTGGNVGAAYSVIATSTIADLVAAINASDSSLTASFNTTTQKVDVTAPDGTEITVTSGGATTAAFGSLGFATSTAVTLTSGTGVTYGAAGSQAEVGTLNTDFQSILEQIDKLITDASYKGNNLLKGNNDSVVKFNEDGSSAITVTGLDLGVTGNTGLSFTADADGYDFTTVGGITQALVDTAAAVSQLRSISATFGADMGVIQTRETFTNELVNVLESGAGKLVNANLEEESANMLALQTRQALGIQALSISNQSNQSILSLFR